MDKIHSFMKKQFVQKSGVRSGNLTIGQKSYKTRKILQSGIPAMMSEHYPAISARATITRRVKNCTF